MERSAGYSAVDAADQVRALNEPVAIPLTTSSSSFSLNAVLASRILSETAYTTPSRSFLEGIAGFRAFNQPTYPSSPSVQAVMDLCSLNR